MRRRNRLATWLLSLLGILATGPGCAGNFQNDPQVEAFIDEMVQRHHFDRAALQKLFAGARKREDILEAISRPAEKTKPWYEYRKIFLTPDRIEGGVRFWRRNADILERARKAFGVDPAVVVAIIGVETRFGANTGSYRVIDALSTLAFAYPPRSKFFRSELEEFLVLAQEEGIDASKATGSYAGAMGYGQFIPSSYRNYAIDFNKDGKRDLWDSLDDIIGSVANYFHRHGWKAGEPVAARVNSRRNIPDSLLSDSLEPERTAADFAREGISSTPPMPPQQPVALLKLELKDGPGYWLTTRNFYVITRYNRSPLYSMAVYQLAEAIRDAYHKSRS